MCEIEDLSLGHQDIYFNKYSDCFIGNTMDLYITDSLQDMLDIDIKSEMATDLGSGTDLSDTLGVNFSDLPPLLDMEMDNANSWMTGSNSNLHSSSSFVQNLDLYGSEANAVMVNPNSVMPSVFTESPIKSIMNEKSSDLMLNCVKSESPDSSPLASLSGEDSHLTFSPNTIKLTHIKNEIDHEMLDSFDQRRKNLDSSNIVFIKRDNIEQIKKDLNDDIDAKPKFSTISALRVKPANADLKLNKNCSILSNQRLNRTQYITGQLLGSKTIISSSVQLLHNRQKTYVGNGNSPTTILIDNSSFNGNRQVIKTVSSSSFSDNPKLALNKTNAAGEFPKPAYSYSCLIAMALKNSRTGSLPVSEIYNFMCQHFPYFKTAPNGWKNSVRHNLSLNKCFEKIEKPSTNGGQRKGCLWAMNPSKIGKMDEEVQKWSRKDPQAIRKAMVHPDSLEALERGEMKFCSSEETNGADEDCSDDDLDVDEMMHTDEPSADIEVIDGYDEIEVEDHKIPLHLEFSVASPLDSEICAKRSKPTIIHKINSSPSHSNRRKTPLVNRIA